MYSYMGENAYDKNLMRVEYFLLYPHRNPLCIGRVSDTRKAITITRCYQQ